MEARPSLGRKVKDVWNYTEQKEVNEPASRFVRGLYLFAPFLLVIALYIESYYGELHSALGMLLITLLSYLVYVGFRRGDYLGGNLKQLWFLALGAQIPWLLYYDKVGMNFLFTVALGLMFLRLGWAYAGIFMYIGYVLPIEFGWFGLLLPSLFHLLEKNRAGGFALYLFAVTLETVMTGDVWVLLSLLGIVFCLCDMKSEALNRKGKWRPLYPFAYILGLIILLYLKFS